MDAARLAPLDVKPVSNISAVNFEMGNYVGAAIFAQKALGMLDSEEDSSRSKQTLLLRLARASVYTRNLGTAEKTLKRITGSVDESLLSAWISHTVKLSTQYPKTADFRLRVLDELPRFNPPMYVFLAQVTPRFPNTYEAAG